MLTRRSKEKSTNGFSLIELMAVVTIAGVLAGISIPSFQRNWQQERLKVASRETTTWLEDIRMRAVQQSAKCVVEINDNTAILQPEMSTNECENIRTLNLRNEIANAKSLVICSQEELEPNNTNCSAENSNAVPTELVFTPRGTIAKGGLIQLHFDSTIPNRCIAITQPLGIIRQGIKGSNGCNFNTAF